MPAVALFTRAWIEIAEGFELSEFESVALFTRAWIEIGKPDNLILDKTVALFTRAWIEISAVSALAVKENSRPLHEGVD